MNLSHPFLPAATLSLALVAAAAILHHGLGKLGEKMDGAWSSGRVAPRSGAGEVQFGQSGVLSVQLIRGGTIPVELKGVGGEPPKLEIKIAK